MANNLDVKRYPVPHKGWNTITPIREMEHEYAPVIENHWFDQAGGMNRRPGQAAITTIPLPTSMTNMFEHRDITGTTTLFAHAGNTIYRRNGTTFVSSLAGVFSQKPRAAQMGGALIAGDGNTVRTYTTAGGWSATAPTGAAGMNMFVTYNGRVFGAGNPANEMTVYYSAPNSAAGITDWSILGPGGAIDLTESIGTGDTITGLAVHQNYLVVFLHNSIVFYDTNLSQTKVIQGIGCLSHDSIQGVGNDTMFLSAYGVKKLTEILVRGDAAAGDASSAINNFVVERLLSGTININTISSTFAEKFGVYLCTFGKMTLAYHILFDAWTPWYGLSPVLYTASNGTVYSGDLTLQEITISAKGDTIGAAAEVAITTRWETAPFKGVGDELKTRWRTFELIYEAEANDNIQVSRWMDLNPDTRVTNTITLNPAVTISNPNGMIWSMTVGSADPRMYWGGVANGNVWNGSQDNLLAGDIKIPLVGRSEILNMSVINTNLTSFKITANEIYSIAGGLRK